MRNGHFRSQICWERERNVQRWKRNAKGVQTFCFASLNMQNLWRCCCLRFVDLKLSNDTGLHALTLQVVLILNLKLSYVKIIVLYTEAEYCCCCSQLYLFNNILIIFLAITHRQAFHWVTYWLFIKPSLLFLLFY